MGRITDQQQSGTIPPGQAVRLNRKHGHLLPLLQGLQAISPWGLYPRYFLSQCIQASRANLLIPTLGNTVANLPVIIAIEHHQNMTSTNAATGFLRIAWPPGQAKP